MLKIRQNIWKFGQKCTKFENILKKGKGLHVITTHNKLLDKALGDLSAASIFADEHQQLPLCLMQLALS